MSAERTVREYELRSWEFQILLLQSLLLAAALMAIVLRLPDWIGSLIGLPKAFWMGLGFLVPGLVLYPAIRVQLRNAYGRELPFRSVVVWAVGVAAVGGLIFWLIQRFLP